MIAFNFTFFKRGMTYPTATEITNSDWYTPKAMVSGNDETNYKLSDSLSISSAVLDTISNYAEAQNSSALLVLHKNELQYEKYWRGNTKSSTTNSMSMAKTIISFLIGIAIEEGKIKSEKEIAAAYITEWAYDDREMITIEDLLLMQSGLRNNDDTGNIFSDLVEMYLGDDVQNTAIEVPLEKPPATVFEYNNVNTQILAIILERATGQSIESYTSEKLWNPLGAAEAGWWLDQDEGMPKAFCCFFAQAEDWMLLGQLILQNGNWNGQQIISEKWLQKMLVQSTFQKDYGYHIWLNYEEGGRREKNRTAPFLAKNYGIDGANKQHVFIVPDYDLVIVRIGEKPDDWDESFMVNKVLEELMAKN